MASYTKEYSQFGSAGWSAYRGVFTYTKTSTTGNAKTKIEWEAKVQMKYAWGYGVGIQVTGADKGTAAGYLTSNPGSTWVTVKSTKGDITVNGTTSTQTKKFTFTAYGVTVSGHGSAGGSVSNSVSVTVPALKKYTIKYDSNKGTGAPSSQSKYYGKKITLRTGEPTRKGYTFKGWNTKKDGSGTTYKAGGSYSANADVTLYARWEATPHTITYYKNASSAGSPPSKQTKNYGVDVTISGWPNGSATKTGCKFIGWATSSDSTEIAYKAKEKYKAEKDLSLYAIWQDNTYTVVYDLNGGSGTAASQSAIAGENIVLDDGTNVNPPSGQYLDHWKSTSSGNDYSLGANFNTTATGNVTLKAIYEDIPDNYTEPKIKINGYRVIQSGTAINRRPSNGGKAFNIDITWTKGWNGTSYNSGTVTLYKLVNNTWESVYTTSSGNVSSYSYYIPSPQVGAQYKAVITDTVESKTIETSIITVSARVIPTTINIGQFKAQRRSNISNIVDFNFDWEAYTDGNSVYDEGTKFTIGAILCDADGIPINLLPITVETDFITGSEGITYGTIEISAGNSANFYILDFTSKHTGDTDAHYNIDNVETSNPRDKVLQGGFPVHINSSGEGISLFGIATDTLNGLDINGELFAERTIHANGTFEANRGVYLPNYTGLYGKNKAEVIEDRRLITYNNVNNLLIGSPDTRKDYNGTTGGQTTIYGHNIHFLTGSQLEASSEVRIDTSGDIFIKNHDGPIGELVTGINGSQATMTLTQSPKKMGSIYLTTGMWVYSISAKIGSGTAGARRMVLVSNANYSTTDWDRINTQSFTSHYVGSTSLGVTLEKTAILQVNTPTRYYLYFWSTAGNPVLSYTMLRAVRIR